MRSKTREENKHEQRKRQEECVEEKEQKMNIKTEGRISGSIKPWGS